MPAPALAPAPVPQTEADHRLLEGIAGALRDSLNTIRGFSELLALGAGDARDIRNSCRFILENSEELSGFVAQLQDFVRLEQGRLRLVEQQVDAAELIEAALGPCRRMAEKADVVIVATLLEGLELRCDATRLRQSLASLVLWMAGNAPGRSLIKVKLHTRECGAAEIEIAGSTRLPAGWEQAALFEPRLALDGLNGLALPIASRVALLHSGSLTIDSGSGAGITARLILPPQRVIGPEQRDDLDSRAA